MRGNGQRHLYPFPPVLALTGSVTNDVTTLILNTDYAFLRQAWANGPYLGLELKDVSASGTWCGRNPDSVSIPARVGFYERSALLDVTVQDSTEQSISQVTLKVSNGGKVSPGMTLLIGTEQEVVTSWGDPTAQITDLNGAITSTEDVVTLVNGALVNVGEILRVDFEQMRVKDKRAHQCHVDRGWNNTGQVAHLTATDVDVYRRVNVERAVNGTIAAAHALNTAISRYMIPDDILFLTKQIATLMINKSRGGYAGKSGNAESGEVFYYDVFPRFEIERIKQNYQLGDS